MILWTAKPAVSPLLMAGLLLLLVSMSFKVSAAPFHFWTPDVYDGAPTVFTSFMATIVKVSIFVGFVRLFDEGFGQNPAQWQIFVAIIAAATLFIGNITAVFQQSVKRMLAYSSIAQAGFMLLALLSLTGVAKDGILLYAAVYSIGDDRDFCGADADEGLYLRGVQRVGAEAAGAGRYLYDLSVCRWRGFP